MDRGQQEVRKESTGHNPSVQPKNMDDCEKQSLPSTSYNLNLEKKQSRAGMKIGQMNRSIGKVHQILRKRNLMIPIYYKLLVDTQALSDQCRAHYREGEQLITLVGFETYRLLYLENLVYTSSMKTLQSDPIIWAAYMRGREDVARGLTKPTLLDPDSVLAEMLSTFNISRLHHGTISTQGNFELIEMLNKVKEHFQRYKLLKRKERKLLRAAKYGMALTNSYND